MPEEHYLAPIIRAFLTTQAGIQLLKEPVDQPIDSQRKSSRNFLESSEAKHETLRLKSSYSSPCPPASRSVKSPHPNQNMSRCRRTPTNGSTPRADRPNLSQIQDNSSSPAFTAFAPLSLQSCRDSAKAKPSWLNKNRVLKNDACSASFAAAKNSAAPGRGAGTSSYSRGCRSQKFSSLQEDQASHNTPPVHKDSRLARL
eukprot:XP_001708937.1 Hypothetical protein GL50803_20181 [Giardia lamblia ATCC 50803]